MTLLNCCVDVLQGLHYLSSRRIVHRDVSARNVLLDGNEVCKLAHFGRAVASAGVGKDDAKSSEELPIRHAAVEVLESGQFSTASDVWSFGCLVWEVFAAGVDPYHNIASCTDVSNHVRAGGEDGGSSEAACRDLQEPDGPLSPADRPGMLDLYTSAVYLGATPSSLAQDEMQSAFPASCENLRIPSRRDSLELPEAMQEESPSRLLVLVTMLQGSHFALVGTLYILVIWRHCGIRSGWQSGRGGGRIPQCRHLILSAMPMRAFGGGRKGP